MKPRLRAWLSDAALVVASLMDVWIHFAPDERLRMACALFAALALWLRRRLALQTLLFALPSTLFSDSTFATLAALWTLASLSRHRLLLAGCALAYAACDLTWWSWPSPEFLEPHDDSALVTVLQPGNRGRSRLPRPARAARRELWLRLDETRRRVAAVANGEATQSR
ncbi:hypothetical protein [Streptomyces europaeiscabiei]|uniref:hypothetical protein n=1 Tax=Streptomyces europaeiscabiei TaxID=146819 RepID=UPI002E2BA1BD|nr:hypothetical protein [Streptomyces europaeiscabiei]